MGVLGTDLDFEASSGVLTMSFFCLFPALLGGGEAEDFLFVDPDGVIFSGVLTASLTSFLGEIVGCVEVLATSTSKS